LGKKVAGYRKNLSPDYLVQEADLAELSGSESHYQMKKESIFERYE